MHAPFKFKCQLDQNEKRPSEVRETPDISSACSMIFDALDNYQISDPFRDLKVNKLSVVVLLNLLSLSLH
jgi:hypothetical protein